MLGDSMPTLSIFPLSLSIFGVLTFWVPPYYFQFVAVNKWGEVHPVIRAGLFQLERHVRPPSDFIELFEGFRR